ncbi:MAG: polysaccharide biosynthesis C-terminal domain-containing protein [Fimbriimonadaceae bacterium]|nr:polysaccharide biosynthesis C-terminal domain-containing protein [Chitinophagales bacterium]
MNANLKITSVNLFIRGITLAAKFILIILIAEIFTLEQLGVWGIFTTSITLMMYIVGIDFYTFSTRTFLRVPPKERGAMLRDQFVFYLLNYAVLLPILAFTLFPGIIEMKYIFFFYAILILEHLSQEAHRTLVVFSKPLQANILLFFRNGLWVYVLVILWLLGFEKLKTINWIFIFWISGGIITLFYSAYTFSAFRLTSIKTIPINWKWIKEGIKVSLLFFTGTIGYRIIDVADRYFIKYYRSEAEAGIYVFYATLSNLIEIIVYTAVIIIFTPKLIEQFNSDTNNYKETFYQFARQIIYYTCGAFILLIAGVIPVLFFLDKPEFSENIPVFILLSFSKAILSLSLIFHYILYIRRRDRQIVIATIIGAVITIALNFIMIPVIGMIGAAISTLTGLCLLFGFKFIFSYKYPEAKTIFKKPQTE